MTEENPGEGKTKGIIDAFKLTAWLGLLCSLELVLAVVAPVILAGLPLFVLLVSTAYVVRIRHHDTADEDQEQWRESALLAAQRLAFGAVAASATSLVMWLIGGTPLAVWLGILDLGTAALVLAWPEVFGRADAAGVPHIGHADSRLRRLLSYIGLAEHVLRAEGSAALPSMFKVHLVALLFAVLSQGVGPAQAQSVVVGLAPQTRPIFHAFGYDLPPAASKDVGSDRTSVAAESTPPSLSQAAPHSTPTALRVSPGPRAEQVLATMSTGVQVKAGKALFAAWRKYGGAVIGCPDGPPHRVGHVWVQPLTNGEDTPSEVVYGEGHAAAVLSDFYNVTVAVLPDTAWVDDRLRWGLGTLQLLRMRDGSCQLAQRYEQDDSTLLTPGAVTAAVIEVGHTFGAIPWVRSELPTSTGAAFEVHFVAPGDASAGYRDLRTITFRYADGRVVRADTDAVVATAGATCPKTAVDLPATAAQVEQTVQVGHG